MRDVPGLEDVNSDLQLKNPQVAVDLDRDRIAALGLDGQPGRNGDVQRLRHAPGVADLRAEQSVPGHDAGRAGVPARSVGAVAALRPLVERPPRFRSTRSPGQRPASGPLTVSHTGQLPSVTISFNLKPGVALGDAVTTVQQVAGRTLPSTVVDQLPGHGAGLPGFAAGPRHHPDHGDRGHLHRARRALRELHASAHDSLGAAVRRASALCSRCSSSRPN